MFALMRHNKLGGGGISECSAGSSSISFGYQLILNSTLINGRLRFIQWSSVVLYTGEPTARGIVEQDQRVVYCRMSNQLALLDAGFNSVASPTVAD